jgi:hypothetical protein
MQPLRSQIFAWGSEYYEISDQDTSASIQYFGYLNLKGLWIVQAFNTATGTYRYANGNSSYSTNWGIRASLTYVYYNQLSNTVP